jgi:hypothetical protein
MTLANAFAGRRLGRRPPKRAPSLKLGPLLTGALPPVPVTADHFGQISDWGLYGNDRFGVCGPVSVANYIKMVTRYLTGTEVSVTQADVFDLYRRSGNPHFDPVTDADDNGVDMQTMLEALTRGGIGGAHQPICFAQVDHTDPAEVRAAVAIFGGVLFGVDLRVAQQAQTDAGLWDYVPGSQEWGGHAVLCGTYRSGAVADVTWAMVVGATDAFLAHQLDEAWVVVMPEHLGTTAFLQGVDLPAMKEAFTTLTGRPFPGVVPPTPGPDPGPTPQPDRPYLADDRALVALVGRWASGRHYGPAARVARALRAWRRAHTDL